MIDEAAALRRPSGRQQRDLSARQPVRLPPGHRPPRLPVQRLAQRLRPLPARQVRPRSSRWAPSRLEPADDADQPPAARQQLPGVAHVGGVAEHRERDQGQRVVERPAHSAGGRELEARRPTAMRITQLYDGGALPGRHSERRPERLCELPRAALLAARRRPPTSPSTTRRRGSRAITRCKGGVKYIRNRKDQNGRPNYLGQINFNTGGNPELHRLLGRRHAARQLPHLQRGVGRSGRLLPLQPVRGVRLGQLARERTSSASSSACATSSRRRSTPSRTTW